MRRVRRFFARLANLFWRDRADREFAAEVTAHLTLMQEEFERRGMAPHEALREAYLKLGGVEQAKEIQRETRSLFWLESLWRDARFGLRSLRKNPGFTIVAVLSLALGIGATTAVFSVVYAALINPYPYPSANRIVRMRLHRESDPDTGVWINGTQIQQIRQLAVIQSAISMDIRPMVVGGGDVPENANAVELISNGFNDLGVPPILGRGLLPTDAIDGQDPQPVAVISYKFWRKHYLSDPGVLGKTLELDQKDYVIIGVAAPRFVWYNADVYLPLKLIQGPTHFHTTDLLLKPGVTNRQAEAALEPIFHQFAEDMPPYYAKQFNVQLEGMNEWVNRSIRGTLLLLLGAVALLLAIGCANVSILLLARGSARQHELTVRAAIGASRKRILRQLLIESLLLAAIGVALGVLASYGMLSGIKAVLPGYAFAPEVVISISLPALLVNVAVGLATGILFGMWPALRLSRAESSQVMASGTRRVAGSVSGRRTHGLLIASQVALTLLLLAAAGSATQGFLQLLHKPLGYDPHNAMSVGLPIRAASYPTLNSRARYIEQLREKVSETPGVTMTAISMNATPPDSGDAMPFEILGQPSAQQQAALINWVDAGYFALLRIPLLQGRIWDETETRNAAHVVVVNRTFAQRYFPNGSAIGHSVRMPGIDDRPPMILTVPGLDDALLPIVGVVGDALDNGIRNPIEPAVFMPYTLSMVEGTQILVRAKVPPLALLHAIKERLATVNPDQQTYRRVDNLETRIVEEPEWQQEHLAVWIFGIMAWLGLALAAAGLYSVVSYTVTQRTNEFGIRMALGARPQEILGIVLASTLSSLVGGITLGLVLSLALNGILEKWIHGNLHDPLILGVGLGILAAVAILASAIPAVHAATIDPTIALRHE